jgi:GNAT superfamily N-acetyltransferase
MGIRFAVPKDTASIIELGRVMHACTRFKALPYEPDRVAAAIQTMLERADGRYALLVAESAPGEIIGVLTGVIERPVFSSACIANVMHFDVLPERRSGGWGVKLLHSFEHWALKRGAFEIVLGVNSAADWQRTGRFLRKAGYSMTGENFVKEVPR